MPTETLGRVSFESAVRECLRPHVHAPGELPKFRIKAHLVTIQGQRRWLYEIHRREELPSCAS